MSPPARRESLTLTERLLGWRLRATIAGYRLGRALGAPDYADEIAYWDGLLRERPPSLFDEAVRRTAFPAELRDCAARLGGVPRLLEVGSGPVSVLAAGADERLFTIVAVDPLARVYRSLLALHGIPYPIHPVPGAGERLRRFPTNAFDVVYSSNALDHARSPERCLEEMCRVLRPGGFMLLEGFVREGSQGGWLGLHQHDLFCEDGALVHVGRDGRRSNLIAGLPLTCASERTRPFGERRILSFGYELPPDIAPDGPDSWLLRDWYTLLLRREAS